MVYNMNGGFVMTNYRNYPTVQEIYKMLYFHLMKMDLRLLPFMDRNIPLPTSLEIADTLRAKNRSANLGVRITQGLPLPEQQQIIELSECYTGVVEKSGGIEKIRDVIENWGYSNTNGHNLLWTWSCKGEKCHKTMIEIADLNGYSCSSTLYKMRDKYLKEIAFNIFMQCTSKQSKNLGKKQDNN